MFYDEDDESPASVEVKTTHHGTVDLNNIPGRVKRMLIESGELSPEQFVSAPEGIDKNNAPGKIMGPLRAAAKARWEGMNKKPKKQKTILKYEVGETVLYKNVASEIQEVNEKRGVKVVKRNGEISGWIPFGKLKPVDADMLEKQQEN